MCDASCPKLERCSFFCLTEINLNFLKFFGPNNHTARNLLTFYQCPSTFIDAYFHVSIFDLIPMFFYGSITFSVGFLLAPYGALFLTRPGDTSHPSNPIPFIAPHFGCSRKRNNCREWSFLYELWKTNSKFAPNPISRRTFSFVPDFLCKSTFINCVQLFSQKVNPAISRLVSVGAETSIFPISLTWYWMRTFIEILLALNFPEKENLIKALNGY